MSSGKGATHPARTRDRPPSSATGAGTGTWTGPAGCHRLLSLCARGTGWEVTPAAEDTPFHRSGACATSRCWIGPKGQETAQGGAGALCLHPTNSETSGEPRLQWGSQTLGAYTGQPCASCGTKAEGRRHQGPVQSLVCLKKFVPLSWQSQGQRGFSQGRSAPAAFRKGRPSMLSFTRWQGWELCLWKIKTLAGLKAPCKVEAGDEQSASPLLDELPFSSTSLLQQALNTRGAAALSLREGERERGEAFRAPQSIQLSGLHFLGSSGTNY